jgi:hypothetical protein
MRGGGANRETLLTCAILSYIIPAMRPTTRTQTAKALRIDVPPTLLAIAEVIE